VILFIDKSLDKADFIIIGKRILNQNNRLFIPRYPSYLLPGSPNFSITKYCVIN
jgi:hypothetical protein